MDRDFRGIVSVLTYRSGVVKRHCLADRIDPVPAFETFQRVNAVGFDPALVFGNPRLPFAPSERHSHLAQRFQQPGRIGSVGFLLGRSARPVDDLFRQQRTHAEQTPGQHLMRFALRVFVLREHPKELAKRQRQRVDFARLRRRRHIFMRGQADAVAVLVRSDAAHTVEDHAILHQQQIAAPFHRLDDDRNVTFLPLDVNLDDPFPIGLADVRNHPAFDVAAEHQAELSSAAADRAAAYPVQAAHAACCGSALR